MLFVPTDDGGYKIMFGESDPTLIYSSGFERIPLDEEHPEYVLKEGDIVIFACAEKFNFSIEMYQMREGALRSMDADSLVDGLSWLRCAVDRLYHYEPVKNGIPLLDSTFFESEEDAWEFVDRCACDDDGIDVRRVLIEEQL